MSCQCTNYYYTYKYYILFYYLNILYFLKNQVMFHSYRNVFSFSLYKLAIFHDLNLLVCLWESSMRILNEGDLIFVMYFYVRIGLELKYFIYGYFMSNSKRWSYFNFAFNNINKHIIFSKYIIYLRFIISDVLYYILYMLCIYNI